MGYPTAYRTSAARRERQLSRPDPSPSPRRPANDNIKIPRKPANDNYPANLPPKPGSWVKHPALKPALKLAMNVHPFLRILRTLWDAYDLYQYYKNTRISLGDFSVRCSRDVMEHCITPGVCNDDGYCDGPVFGDGVNNCPGPPQAFSYANAHGSAYAAAHRFNNTNGFHVVMVRSPSNIPQPCIIRGTVQASYERLVLGGNKVARMPHLVPYTTSTPPFWAPFRWFKPNIFMKPQVDYDVDPRSPPYRYIPDRDLSDSATSRGYEVEAAPVPRLWPEYAFRMRPPSREKEKKVKWTGPAQIAHAILVSLARVHGKLLDFRDIIEAMEKALPKELRLKGKDKKVLQKRMRNLWDNFENLNGEQAVLNIIEELAEDVIGGVSSNLRSETAKNFGWLKTKTFTSPRF